MIDEFFGAFNRGEPAAASFVAPELAPNGGWYSVSEGAGDRRRHFVAYDRAELRRYFAARRRENERMRLVEIAVGYSGGRGHIEYALERSADDLKAVGIRTSRAGGKGAVDCERRKIVVWSMGMPHGGTSVCPSAAAPRRAIIACVRRRRG